MPSLSIEQTAYNYLWQHPLENDDMGQLETHK